MATVIERKMNIVNDGRQFMVRIPNDIVVLMNIKEHHKIIFKVKVMGNNKWLEIVPYSWRKNEK